MSVLKRKKSKKYNSSHLLGIKFTHSDSCSNLVHTIIEHDVEKHKDDFVFVTWETASSPVMYLVKDVESYFEEGVWRKI